MNPRLVKPTADMEAAYQDFLADWQAAGERFDNYSARVLGLDYRGWVAKLPALGDAETCPRELVPESAFFLADDGGRILGYINIRHRLNEHLLRMGGHIGYDVRPSERRKGYATAMLRLALPAAGELGIRRVLITCDKANTASAKVILNCGGLLENEEPGDGRVTQRYWIPLNAHFLIS